MRCTFCATGRGGWARNLRPHEILDQVLAVQEAYGRRVTNVGGLRRPRPATAGPRGPGDGTRASGAAAAVGAAGARRA